MDDVRCIDEKKVAWLEQFLEGADIYLLDLLWNKTGEAWKTLGQYIIRERFDTD